MKWLTAEEAAQATEDRDQLLSALSGKVNESFLQNKLHQGPLSPGCVTCGEGTWSCIFINGLCTAHCFFCPQDRGMKEERPPEAEGLVFRNPRDYADFVQQVGFKGVGFSGGESLLVYDTLLLFIEELREKLGNDIYLWIYTNGDLVDRHKLEGLKQAGLDEIRFNIAARGYTLRPVELALDIINTVTIEIPAIPEDFEVVKAALSTMESVGVHHLNLHQLHASVQNYPALTHRNYTFLHQGGVPILESEITALRLLLHAVENGLSLPINYCSQAYKNRLQGRGCRMRAAPLVRKDFEEVTDLGYVRRVTVEGAPARLERLVGVLATSGCSSSWWSLNEDGSELSIHPSLLQYIDTDTSTGLSTGDCSFTLRYFKPRFRDANPPSPLQHAHIDPRQRYYKIDLRDSANFEEVVQELVLNPEQTLLVARELRAEYRELSPVAMKSFQKLFIEKMDRREVLRWFFENYDVAAKQKFKGITTEGTILRDLTAWEQVPTGLSEIY